MLNLVSLLTLLVFCLGMTGNCFGPARGETACQYADGRQTGSRPAGTSLNSAHDYPKAGTNSQNPARETQQEY